MTNLSRFIDQPRLREVDHIDVGVPVARAYEVIRHADLARSALVRALFSLRTLPARARGEEPASPSLRIDDIGAPGTGFRVLVDEPGSGFVVGSIGRFWEPDIPFADVPAKRFADFDEPGPRDQDRRDARGDLALAGPDGVPEGRLVQLRPAR